MTVFLWHKNGDVQRKHCWNKAIMLKTFLKPFMCRNFWNMTLKQMLSVFFLSHRLWCVQVASTELSTCRFQMCVPERKYFLCSFVICLSLKMCLLTTSWLRPTIILELRWALGTSLHTHKITTMVFFQIITEVGDNMSFANTQKFLKLPVTKIDNWDTKQNYAVYPAGCIVWISASLYHMSDSIH